jgi:hypothetical protein
MRRKLVPGGGGAAGPEWQLIRLAGLIGAHASESKLANVALRQAVLEARRAFDDDVARIAAELSNVESAHASVQMDLRAAEMEKEMAAAALQLPPTPATAAGPDGMNVTASSVTMRAHAAAAVMAGGFGGTNTSSVMGAHRAAVLQQQQQQQQQQRHMPNGPTVYPRSTHFTTGASAAAGGGGVPRDLDAALAETMEHSLLLEEANRLRRLLVVAVAQQTSPSAGGGVTAGLKRSLESDGCGSITPQQPGASSGMPARRDINTDDDDDDDDRDVDDAKAGRSPDENQFHGAADAAIVAVKRMGRILAVLLGRDQVDDDDGVAETDLFRQSVIAWLSERLAALKRGARGRAGDRSPASIGLSPRGQRVSVIAPHGSKHGNASAVPALQVIGRHGTTHGNANATAAALKRSRRGAHLQQRGVDPAAPTEPNMSVAALHTALPPLARKAPAAGGAVAVTNEQPPLPRAKQEADASPNFVCLPMLKPIPAIAQSHYARLGHAFIQRHVAQEKKLLSQQQHALTPAPQYTGVGGGGGGGDDNGCTPRMLLSALTPPPPAAANFEKIIENTTRTLKDRTTKSSTRLRQEVRIVQHNASLLGAAGKGLRQEWADVRHDEALLLRPTAANSAGTLNDTAQVTRVGKAAEALAASPEAVARAAAEAEEEARRAEERRRALGVIHVTVESSQPYFDAVGKGPTAHLPGNRLLARKLKASAELVADEERALNRLRVAERSGAERPRRDDVAPIVKQQAPS